MPLPANPLLLSDLDDFFTGTTADDWVRGLAGVDVIDGAQGHDLLEGGDGDDSLSGGIGNDTLRGDAGNDTLIGGDANDMYVVFDLSETIVEIATGGYDDGVTAYLDWTLADHLENLTLAGMARVGRGNAVSNWLTGNALDNALYGWVGNDSLVGNDGNDTLDGGAGMEFQVWDTDTMIGGLGNDLYIVDVTNDIAVEAMPGGRWSIVGGGGDDDGGGAIWIPGPPLGPMGGHDTVHAFADYTLAEEIDDMVLFTGAWRGTGNVIANRITGHDGANSLNGAGGADTLIGGLGNDQLEAGGSGSGIDSLVGGEGNDVLVPGSGSTVAEGGAGSDVLWMRYAFGPVTVDFAAGTMALYDAYAGGTLAGTASFSSVERIAGSEYADVVTGDDGPNVIELWNGNNTAWGGGGDDVINAYLHSNRFHGEAGNDMLTGGHGDDTLDGGSGDDTMTGWNGNDLFIVDSAGDLVSEGESGGNDTVQAGVSRTLEPNIERLVLVGSDALEGTGNSGANRIDGNGGANLLAGAAGNDTLLGGEGDDTLSGGASYDTLDGGPGSADVALFSGARAGYSFVFTGSGYQVYAPYGSTDGLDTALNVETFRFSDGDVPVASLPSDADDSVTGGPGNDLLRAYGGNDQLDGAAGNDTMEGGAGNDSYHADSSADVVSEAAGAGDDHVIASASFTLGANVERLTLTGSAAISATGNTLANTITGNDGDNLIAGGAGSDTIDGGGGQDIAVVGATRAASSITPIAGGLRIATADGVDDISGVEVFRFSEGDYTLAEVLASLPGPGDDTITGGALADGLRGGEGNDSLSGLGGNDTLAGDAGSDTLVGGTGDDLYLVDDGADTLVEAPGEGTDSVQSSVPLALPAEVEHLTLTGGAVGGGSGNALANRLTGNAAANALDGGAGNDTLQGDAGDDSLTGGAGNDQLDGGAGSDRVIFSLARAAFSFTFAGNSATVTSAEGTDTLAGIELWRFGDGDFSTAELIASLPTDSGDTLSGSAGNDSLWGLGGSDLLAGLGGDDSLRGDSGSDTLDGGSGADTMNGGEGDDLFSVDEAGDSVVEASGQGFDEVRASVSFVLPANVEVLTLTGSAAIDATGNAGSNHLYGNTAANVLDGGGEGDEMRGGAGDDRYVFDHSSDQAIEEQGEGDDTIVTSIGLALGSYLEHVELAGSGSVWASGNEYANRLTGNAGNNALSGLDGNDTIAGGGGNDIIEGGDGGTDVAVYALPRSSYAVSLSGDHFTVQGGSEGSDDVYGIEVFRFADGDVTAAELAASLPTSGADDIIGSAAADNLDALGGNDSVAGLGGNDTLQGNSGNDLLTGGAGDDWLLGGSGTDIAVFSAAFAAYSFSFGGANTTVSGPDGSDVVNGVETLRFTDGDRSTADLEGSILWGGDDTRTGTSGADTLRGFDGNDSLVGLAGNDSLAGDAGHDTLDGGSGSDTLAGGAGDDVFIVDNGDSVVEAAGGGTDTVHASTTHTLAAHVEHLLLTGIGHVNGTGNTLANRIEGNGGNNSIAGGDGNDELIGGAGNDTLSGGSGNNTLAGGSGNDSYVVASAADLVVEDGNDSADGVQAAVSYTLPATIEQLTLTGSSGLSGTGNALDNTITGNGGNNSLAGGAGNDTLAGGSGNDTLAGGAGNDRLDGGSGSDAASGGAGDDTYLVASSSDSVIEAAGEGADEVQAATSYTLPAHVERLVLTGSSGLAGTGNAQDNTLSGNSGSNSLTGGDGNDTLAGAAGTDTLAGGSGDDVLSGGSGSDRLTGGAGADRFHFNATNEGSDTATDFSTADDLISLLGSAFGGLAAGALDPARLVAGTAPTAAFGQLLYEASTGRLRWDADGTGGGSSVLLVTLTGLPALTAEDIVVG